jgi:taurine dioxygenase
MPMTTLKIDLLSDELPFGVRVTGVTFQNVHDDAVRGQLREIFEERGLVLFEDMGRTTEMQVALSGVFGPLENHPLKAIPRVDGDNLPGVIDIYVHPDDASIVELNGRQLSSWAPWHFDSAYTKKICRAGVLRALEIPPEGGMTGFADGKQLYRDIDPELRDRFEDLKIIYDPHMLLSNLKFGMPKDWRYVRMDAGGTKLLETTAGSPRSVHPAIWRTASGEGVLHVSWQNAAGILGHEDAQGEALLHRLCREMEMKMQPYWHRWRPRDMVIFDNWRFVHAIGGNDPKYIRRMHRTTIEGDYGLGAFEKELTGIA